MSELSGFLNRRASGRNEDHYLELESDILPLAFRGSTIENGKVIGRINRSSASPGVHFGLQLDSKRTVGEDAVSVSV